MQLKVQLQLLIQLPFNLYKALALNNILKTHLKTSLKQIQLRLTIIKLIFKLNI